MWRRTVRRVCVRTACKCARVCLIDGDSLVTENETDGRCTFMRQTGIHYSTTTTTTTTTGSRRTLFPLSPYRSLGSVPPFFSCRRRRACTYYVRTQAYANTRSHTHTHARPRHLHIISLRVCACVRARKIYLFFLYCSILNDDDSRAIHRHRRAGQSPGVRSPPSRPPFRQHRRRCRSRPSLVTVFLPDFPP